MANDFRVTVYNAKIISVIQVGDVGRWSRGQAKDIENLARRTAPSRSGRLRASHVTLPGVGSNQYHKRWRVSALAPYSAYVHQGTGVHVGRGPIYRANGGKMGPIDGLGPRFITHHSGQRSQPWLERSAMVIGARM